MGITACVEGVAGFVYGPTGTVWFALQNVHRLVEFDPRTGEFRSYGGGTAWLTPINSNVSSRVDPIVRPVVPAPVECYLDFPLPYPLMSHGISLDEPRGAGPVVFFTHGSANTIGELHP